MDEVGNESNQVAEVFHPGTLHDLRRWGWGRVRVRVGLWSGKGLGLGSGLGLRLVRDYDCGWN